MLFPNDRNQVHINTIRHVTTVGDVEGRRHWVIWRHLPSHKELLLNIPVYSAEVAYRHGVFSISSLTSSHGEIAIHLEFLMHLIMMQDYYTSTNG